MSLARLVAIVVVYLIACAGWMVLGTTTAVRSGALGDRLSSNVVALWGGPLVQDAPTVHEVADTGSDGPARLAERSTIAVDLRLEHRRKGLIWYPTYRCRFTATYVLSNPGAQAMAQRFRLALPVPDGTYDGFAVTLDGQPSPQLSDPSQGINELVTVPPGGEVAVGVTYETRGLATWHYRPGVHLGRVRGLDLTVHCDTAAIDFPDGCLSPNTFQRDASSSVLRWNTSELITRRDIGIAMPERLNPGPLSARITFFAPVCLGFFFLLIGAVTVVRGIAIHPMHYLFVAAGFFAFHLLLAYLVDQFDIHLSFTIAATTAVTLVTLYLRSALGPTFPTLIAIAGQAFFLVLFSYSFFLKGMTGLTVAVGSVVTLAVLMRLTAKLDWTELFRGTPKA